MSNQPAQTKALKPADEVRNNLEKMKPQFQAALPSHIDASKFLRVVQTAVASNKDILNADRTSLFSSCMKAAADGLIPDGREAALVVFNGKKGPQVQYMPMVGGILKKIRNSGELATITSMVIHKNDTFEYYVDDKGEHFIHKPLLFGDRGEQIGVYALARTKDGAVYIEVMTKDQVMSVKKVSRGASNGPWSGDFQDEMWRKSVVRRLAKRLPSSSDLDMTLRNDDETYDMSQETVASEAAEAKPAKRKGLRVSELVKNSPANTDTTPKENVQAKPDGGEIEGEVVDASWQDVPEQNLDEELPI